MSWYIGIVFLCLGALIACFNFYLSFIRFSVHRLRKESSEYRWVSGIPLVGSLLLWIAAVLFLHHRTLMWTALGISLLDTGGIHWFAGMTLYFGIVDSVSGSDGATRPRKQRRRKYRRRK